MSAKKICLVQFLLPKLLIKFCTWSVLLNFHFLMPFSKVCPQKKKKKKKGCTQETFLLCPTPFQTSCWAENVATAFKVSEAEQHRCDIVGRNPLDKVPPPCFAVMLFPSPQGPPLTCVVTSSGITRHHFHGETPPSDSEGMPSGQSPVWATPTIFCKRQRITYR